MKRLKTFIILGLFYCICAATVLHLLHAPVWLCFAAGFVGAYILGKVLK